MLLPLSSFSAQAKILETAHIADIIPLIDDETWVLVDLDNTMFEAAQALGHADWFYDELQIRASKGMTHHEAIADFYPQWVKTQNVCCVKPIEKEFIPALHNLQDQGITIMGFTHRQPIVADATLRQIDSLGFDFSKTAPVSGMFEVEATFPNLYKEGVFFASDYNRKGDVFIPFTEKAEVRPKKVLFIDDKRKNIDELENLLKREGIDYIGVHYTAIFKAAPVYVREIAEFQYKFLDRILTNEEALALMEGGIAKEIAVD